MASVTLVLPAEQTQKSPTRRESGYFRVCSRVVPTVWHSAVLLVGTAALYLWNLSASGWANSFYSAAAQAGANNWTAMLFGSSDAANAITVDKTPASLWIMDISVRMFGLNPWSVLVPQALEGVAAVAILYAAVRRVSGPGAALLAGSVMALTPVAALMFRFNNPDALLVLMLVAGGYCMQRACEKDSSRWWLVAAGAAVGFGFLAKMLQAFLVLPGFIAAYLLAGSRPLRRRLLDAVGLVAAMVVSAGWFLALVEVWPSDARPYIGGSQHDSIVELALGYNGLGRLTGDETGGLGNMNFDVGWGRLFGHGMGTEIAWLLPAAVICLGAVAGPHPAGTPNGPHARRGADLGRLAGGDGGGVQLHERHRAPVLHRGAGPGDRRVHRHRRNTVVAEPIFAAVRDRAGRRRRSSPRSWRACCWHGPQDWLPWLRPPSPSAEWARRCCCWCRVGCARPWSRDLPPVWRSRCALAGPSAYAVATAATPHRGAIPIGGPVTRWCDAVGCRAACSTAPTPGARTVGDARRRRRRLHVGGGGDGIEQRRGLPVGQRRAGDGDRRFQRHRSRSDA